MSMRTPLHRPLLLVASVLLVFLALGQLPGAPLSASGRHRYSGPTQSGPIAITSDDRYVWVVNPDNDLVTLIDVGDDSNLVLARVPVGDEPQNIAISPDDKRIYVSNTASGTVSVIKAKGEHSHVIETIQVGTEPYGMAFTPNGEKLYVANARSNDVSVIDAEKNEVVETIDNVGLEPRGVAITNDGDRDDGDEKVYVTQFLAVDRPGVLIGRDDYKEGRVTVISTESDQVLGQVTLNPVTDTGFRSNGSVLNHVPAANPPAFTFVTGAFPNMMNAIAIKGDRAYVPSNAASPDGPVRFNVNVQALLSAVDLTTDLESASQTINLNRGINFEPASPTKLFVGVPWALAFEHQGSRGYVVASAANIVVQVDLDSAGTPTTHAPSGAGQPSGIVRIPVGQNPRGIAINGRDDRAYVMNEVSRDVSVIDLATHAVIATVPTADLPEAGTEAATLQIGKGLFFSSTGVTLPQLGAGGVLGTRLSSEGWSGCVSCHPFGLTDGVVWIFASGPRRVLPLHASFNPRDPADAKILNHSAIFDELQDFELNIRNVSGGPGLITLADGTTPDPTVAAFSPANAGRSPALDALTLFVAKGIRSPISPLSAHRDDQDRKGVKKGRKLFAAANCASCHGGGGWASSRRDFAPPPAATEIVNGQLTRFLSQVGTFDSSAANELRANGAPALGKAGFNPPSLLGAFALGPFLHNGSALTLDQVMENVEHRSAGLGGVDPLADAKDRRRLVRFLESIDATTEPFPLGGEPDPLDDETEAIASQLLTSGLRLELRGENPVRARAEFVYSLPGAAKIELALYDPQGRRVARLADGPVAAGVHRVAWDLKREDGARARAGVYFARLKTPAGLRVMKLVLAR